MTRFVRFAAIATALCAASAHGQLVQYTASYAAQYKGRSVGESVFTLERSAEPGEFVFHSRLQAKGLLRLASPRPVIDRTEFRLAEGSVVPLHFSHEDGSRKGEDNHSIEFDWDEASATVSGDGYTREIPLHAGVQDRGSVQVSLMLTLRAGAQPASLDVVDEESVDEYTFVSQGRHTVSTSMGELETVRYRQQRAGSSRFTLIDFAPALEYVPARIEQFRDGESLTAFQLETYERL